MSSRRFGAALLALALSAGAAAADQKIVHLKNGRKIEGDLVEETGSAYVLKTAHGQVTIAKDNVSSLEAAPEPKKQPLDPLPRKPEPPPEKPAPAPAKKDGGAKKPATAAAAVPLPAGPELASGDEIAAARRALLAVPNVTATDPVGSNAARKKALDEIEKKTSLAALVAIIAEPDAAASPAKPEQTTALGIVQNMDAKKVRPLLIQAIQGVDLSKGQPTKLVGLMGVVGDGDDGAVATAVVARVTELMAAKQDPGPILHPLEWTAKREHLVDLFKLLLSTEDVPMLNSLSKTCKQLVAHDTDREAAIAAIAPLVDAKKLPPLERIAAVLDVFSSSRRDGGRPVGQIIDALLSLDPEDQKRPEYEKCLRNAYVSLVWIWSDESRDRLLRAFDEARAPRRVWVLEAFKVLRVQQLACPPEFAQELVTRMDDKLRTDEEVQAFSTALNILTGQNFGTNVEYWKKYVARMGR